jgi:hypothetical protein
MIELPTFQDILDTFNVTDLTLYYSDDNTYDQRMSRFQLGNMTHECPLMVVLILGYLSLGWQCKWVRFLLLFMVNLWVNFEPEFACFIAW